jgi:hypothetical protein
MQTANLYGAKVRWLRSMYRSKEEEWRLLFLKGLIVSSQRAVPAASHTTAVG